MIVCVVEWYAHEAPNVNFINLEKAKLSTRPEVIEYTAAVIKALASENRTADLYYEVLNSAAYIFAPNAKVGTLDPAFVTLPTIVHECVTLGQR